MLYSQAASGEDGNAENGERTNISITSPGSSDVADTSIIPDNPNSNTENITTKHVKQNSFDSGIADAAHSFSSNRGSNAVTGVLSD